MSRKNNEVKKYFIIILTLLNAITTFGQIKNKGHLTLTVNQSWALIFQGRLESGGYSHFEKLNKNIHPKLIKFLKDDKFYAHKDSMITALGFLSEKGDAKYIEKQLKLVAAGAIKKGTIDPYLYIHVLCTMSSYGNHEATLILNEMFEEKYWKGISFRWYMPPVQHALCFEYQSICRVWTSYALSDHKDFEKKANEIITRYPRKLNKSFIRLKAYLNVDKISKELNFRKSSKSKVDISVSKIIFNEEYLKHLDGFYNDHIIPLFKGTSSINLPDK